PSYYVKIAFWLTDLGSERFPKENQAHVRIRLDRRLPELADETTKLLKLDSDINDAQREERLRALLSRVRPILDQTRTVAGLRQKAHLAGGFQHRPLNLVEGVDLILAHFLGDIVGRQPLALQIALDEAPVLDDHHGLAIQDRTEPSKPKAEIRRANLQQADGGDHQDQAGYREVVLRYTLLNQIADYDQENQVERLQLSQLTAADDSGQRIDEHKRERGADDQVHLGKYQERPLHR